jgi:hypothetical protein
LYVKTLQRRAAFRAAAGLAVAASLGVAAPARGQSLPSEPLSIANGRLTVGADLSITASCSRANTPNASECTDDTGFFNYTDYDHSTLRMLRIDVTAALKATPHLSVLGEVRSENGNGPQPYALYLRVRPWINRDFDIQAGRVPPTFGAFARRTYASDNILIGYPLAYQYLTSLRPDALPLNADELLRMRGRGWLSSFSVGSSDPRHGVPLASGFRWDTGLQLHGAASFLEAAASVTAGTLANPLVKDDNSGKQFAARVAARPVSGLLVGVSGARGPFVRASTAEQAGVQPDGPSFSQTAWGADAEYSRGYYLLRFETIVSEWALPILGSPTIDSPLRAVATSIEGRYKLHPRVYLAARFDRLQFSTITGTARTDTWDANVDRFEAGGGYMIQRNLQLRLSFQHNVRSGGRATRVNAGATQLVFWL